MTTYRHYYNEFDPHAAAWLRELIAAELIPAGEIDTRSITDVSPNDLKPFTQCHFFAGIAGWAYALALAGVDPARPLWTGSCPCQPFSVAGKGLGTADERHLWPVFANLIRECRPPAVFGEQVASRAGRDWLAGVFADLEGMGYAVAGADLCAAGVGAPHIRQRLYWVADASCWRRLESVSGLKHNARNREEKSERRGSSGGVADGKNKRRNGGAGMPWENRGAVAQTSGATCGLADTEHNDRRTDEPGRGSEGREVDGRTGGLGFAQQQGLEGHTGNGNDGHQPGREPADTPRPIAPASGAWDSFDLLPCLDGKTRRIESGTFPLAHGVPGRVGLLRGYGNAIVPQVAAAFVKALNHQ